MEQFRYELKKSLLTDCEKQFFYVIKETLPDGYILVPQVNLASIIRKLGDFKYQNELYRNVDGCIFTADYRPVAVIEINDNTHNEYKRKQRDAKVKEICEEAGIQIVTFWTSYGVNPQYIAKRIAEALAKAPYVERVAHTSAPEENTSVELYQGSEEHTDPSAAYSDDLRFAQEQFQKQQNVRDGYKPTQTDPDKAKLFKTLNYIFYGGILLVVILLAFIKGGDTAMGAFILGALAVIVKTFISSLIFDKRARSLMWQQAKAPIIAISMILLLAILYGIGVSLGFIDPPKSQQEELKEKMEKNKKSICRICSAEELLH